MPQQNVSLSEEQYQSLFLIGKKMEEELLRKTPKRRLRMTAVSRAIDTCINGYIPILNEKFNIKEENPEDVQGKN